MIWNQYDIFYEAISYCPEKGEIGLIGYKLIENYKWKADLKNIKKEIEKYYDNFSETKDTLQDGHAVAAFFHNLKPGQYIHYPSLYCMYEHKKIFKMRVEFLYESGCIDSKDLLEQMEEVVKLYKKIMLMGIQYNSRRQGHLLESMYKDVKKALKKEREVIRGVIENIVLK